MDLSTAPYIGRFAPSPTGPLHAGSLLAAVASYIDAKANKGKWLLRIEDVDRLRIVKGASDSILLALEQHGLHWDGEIQYQSNNDADYQQALNQLIDDQRIFYCNCSRTHLRQFDGPYPGFCRSVKSTQYQIASRQQPASHAIRFDINSCGQSQVEFSDRILALQRFDLVELGDFILRRRDSLFAYQLAVVVDDAKDGINNVVRGADLLSSTPWQIALQQALKLPRTKYAHLPLLIDHAKGQKLSKQTGAQAIDNTIAASNICSALAQLGQNLPAEAKTLPVTELLNCAIEHWQIERVPKAAITGN